MRFAVLLAANLLSWAPALAAAQSASGMLTPASVQGQWLLTFTPSPPRKGFSIKIRPRGGAVSAGAPVTFAVRIDAASGRLAGCTVARPELSGSSVPALCTLTKGKLRIELTGEGGGMIFDLARTRDGGIAGDAFVKAPPLPKPARAGAARLSRA